MSRLLLALSLCLAAAFAVAVDRMAPPAGAQVYFIAPQNGAKLHGPVTIKFGLKGMGIAPAGVKFDNTGHHHLLIDTDLSDVKLDAPLPATDKIVHFGKGQTETTLTLAPGKHTLRAGVRRLPASVVRSAAASRRKSPSPWNKAPSGGLHDARDTAYRHGRFLCVGRGAGSPGTQGQAADRRRQRRPRRGGRGQLRRAALRSAIRHAHARGAAALPGGHLSCARAWRATRKSRTRSSRFFTNSRPWWKACRWTRPFSTSPPAGGCSECRSRSAPKSAAASPRGPD